MRAQEEPLLTKIMREKDKTGKKGNFGINYSLGTVSPWLPLLKHKFILFPAS